MELDVAALSSSRRLPRLAEVGHDDAPAGVYKWLERAYEGGLQLVVMLGVNNEAMCASGNRFASPEFNCQDTMAAVKLQFAKARELEAWLTERCARADPTACAKNLATGDMPVGWFKVVASPADARAAIAKGRLAVVLGIEEATLFGCKVGTCTPQSVQAALQEYQVLGVNHISRSTISTTASAPPRPG